MNILAIDTSCDDTSVAITENRKLLANVFWSKIKTYEKWGGVVPSEAKRQHIEFLPKALEKTFEDVNAALNQQSQSKNSQSKFTIENIDSIAVTYGPGLAIALESGIQTAKNLAKKHNKKLIAVNHMIGHIYSNLVLDENGKSYSGVDEFEFPLLALTISGGHTDLYLMHNHFDFNHIGYTIDDAIGEAFDKVGRMIGLPYPAGPKIEKLAQEGNEDAFKFPRPMSNSNDYLWSYSGLKTAVLYTIKKLVDEYEDKPQKKKFKVEDLSEKLTDQQIKDIAASFQRAAVEALLIKVKRALVEFNPKMLVVGGGVIANSYLREKLQAECEKKDVPLYYPKPIWLCTDNAAMIGVTGYYYAKYNKFVENIDELDRIPNLRI